MNTLNIPEEKYQTKHPEPMLDVILLSFNNMGKGMK